MHTLYNAGNPHVKPNVVTYGAVIDAHAKVCSYVYSYIYIYVYIYCISALYVFISLFHNLVHRVVV